MNSSSRSYLMWISAFVILTLFSYVVFSQYTMNTSLKEQLKILDSEKTELTFMFQEAKKKYIEIKSLCANSLEKTDPSKQQTSELELEQKAFRAMFKECTDKNNALTEENSKLKLAPITPKPPTFNPSEMTDWNFHDYRRLYLELIEQQKLYRYLWKPEDGRPVQRVVILTDLHNPPQKKNEPLIALQANLLNYFVEEVHLLIEKNDKFQDVEVIKKMIHSEKVKFHYMDKRWTPADAIKYTNDNKALHGKIVIMTNNDIIFDHTLISMKEFDRSKKQIWAISRRRSVFDGRRSSPPINWIEIHPDMCWSYVGSHDGYIFVPPVDERVLPDVNDFYLGEWGCENRILWAFANTGYSQLNPCHKINLWHYTTAYYAKSNNRRVNRAGRNHVVDPSPPDANMGIETGWASGLGIREQDTSKW